MKIAAVLFFFASIEIVIGSCVFPFVYMNQTYHTCTRKDYGRLWCGTTENVDIDKKYGFCEGADYCSENRRKAIAPNTKEFSCCYFPFTYNGTTYDSCTTVDYGRKWCSLTSDVDRDGLYGYCESANYCTDKRRKAIDRNTEELSCCYFPFTYNGNKYDSCTTVDYGRKWCSLTSDIDKDGLYGYCESANEDYAEQFERDMYHETDWY